MKSCTIQGAILLLSSFAILSCVTPSPSEEIFLPGAAHLYASFAPQEEEDIAGYFIRNIIPDITDADSARLISHLERVYFALFDAGIYLQITMDIPASSMVLLLRQAGWKKISQWVWSDPTDETVIELYRGRIVAYHVNVERTGSLAAGAVSRETLQFLQGQHAAVVFNSLQNYLPLQLSDFVQKTMLSLSADGILHLAIHMKSEQLAQVGLVLFRLAMQDSSSFFFIDGFAEHAQREGAVLYSSSSVLSKKDISDIVQRTVEYSKVWQ